MGRISASPLYTIDLPGVTTLEMRAKARRMKMELGIELVIVDYLQIMSSSGRRRDNKAAEVSEISRDLKLMARELDIPVIVLSQLSRAVEQRPNKRPMLSDLRESGAIEQDADLVWFIYRDSYYTQMGEGGIDYTRVADAEEAELNIAKHRNGATGKASLTWFRRFATFDNFVRED
jgi:replicative DNA helicase